MAKFRYWVIELLVLGLLIVGLLTWHVGFKDVVDVLRNANPWAISGYLGVSLLIALFLTLKWLLVLHSQNESVPFHRLFTYRLVGYSVNYLTPTMHVGSEPIRAVLLQREGIPVNKSFSNVIIDKSIELITNVTFFFIGALVILNSVLVDFHMKLAILGISLLAMLLMGMFIMGVIGERSMFLDIFRTLRLDRIKRLKPIEKNLAAIEKQIEFFYTKKTKYFWGLIGIMVGLWVLMYFEYRFALLILQESANVFQIFLILTGVGLAYSIPIPAAMGTLELGQLSAAKVLRLSSVTGIALAWIVRARDLIWTILGLVFLTYYHFSFKKLAKETKEIDKSFERGNLMEKQTG